MISLDDEGLILSVRLNGEKNAVLSILSRQNGIVKGFVSNVASPKKRSVVQTGNLVKFTWQSRIEDGLGYIFLEPVKSYAAILIADRVAMTMILAVAALVDVCFREREDVGGLYPATVALLDNGGGGNYLKWELLLLKEAGFALDLSRCAATGAFDNLCYVSPKTGRAVSLEGGAPYADMLLKLPGFLAGKDDGITAEDIKAGFALTGYFLRKNLFAGKSLPAVRDILQDYLLN